MFLKVISIFWIFFSLGTGLAQAEKKILVGAFYMPGWQPGSFFWAVLKGEPPSRFPEISWPERKPLLGYYPEGEIWVAEKHLEWAHEAGLDFFIYNWYWLPTTGPYLEHALRAYLQAKGRKLVKFALLWVNHPPFDQSARKWSELISYWEKNFFHRPEYLRLKGKALVLIFDPKKLRKILGGWRKSALVIRALEEKGALPVACLSTPPSYEKLGLLVLEGYKAVSAYNYIGASGPQIDTYDHLILFYQKTWEAYLAYLQKINAFLAGKPAKELENLLKKYRNDPKWRKKVVAFEKLKGSGRQLSYIVPVIPGWDERPLKGKKAYVRVGSTPQKFKKMLLNARRFIEKNAPSGLVERIIIIEAWNEFAEGSYIEPTMGWGKSYLEVIKEVFNKP